EEYWSLRASLAWALELDDELQASLEKLLALRGSLNSGDESQLITMYRTSDPKRALTMMVGSWQRVHDPLRLVEALQQA
ncbi:tetratricopeptide repeat protein, partial [Burkholderia sp. SIMBA_045]